MGCGASTFNNKSHSELSTSKPSILYEIDFDPSYEEISLKSMIFKHVMADPTGRQFFKKYLQKEHAEENIMFYEVILSPLYVLILYLSFHFINHIVYILGCRKSKACFK